MTRTAKQRTKSKSENKKNVYTERTINEMNGVVMEKNKACTTSFGSQGAFLSLAIAKIKIDHILRLIYNESPPHCHSTDKEERNTNINDKLHYT